MSTPLIDRSSDLKRLRDEGYEVEIRSAHLLIHHIPYVNPAREVKYGMLVSELTLAADVTDTPGSHVAMFAGEHPCDRDGQILSGIVHQSERKELAENLVVDHSFSNKPSEGYVDYYEKMTRYATMISAPAAALDPDATARTFRVIESTDTDSPFNYLDTASSRAEVAAITEKLIVGKVAIVGLGGTGSYILDFVAKTPVGEIHLFDGDDFLQHNAFRAPGAASLAELARRPKKVAYLERIYSKLHKRIIVHDEPLEDANVEHLKEMDFVFVAIDEGLAKKVIVESLEAWGKRFIDVGMGIHESDGALGGSVRTTTSTPEKRDHLRARVSFADAADNEYAQNIQIAELNALNAALAVIKWKKLFGFYRDLENEHHSIYVIDGNAIINEDTGAG
jgi:hypothetical protein